MTQDQVVPPARRTGGPRWLVSSIAGLLGLLYAYAVWNAIGNLVQSVQAASSVGLSLTALGWIVWILAAVFPLIVFAVAFRIGAQRPVLQFALVMIVGLAVVAVLWLNVVSYTALNTASLLA